MQSEDSTTISAGRSARPLLPAVRPQAVNRTRPVPSQGLPPRAHTTAACETCRKRKIKCNAARPACGHCVLVGVNCVYSTDSENETHAQALKRKLSELRNRESTFQQIYRHLRDRTETEADEIVKRIKTGADPESILRYITEGDLLLQLALLPETRYRYVFPVMHEMPEFLLHPDNPYLGSRVYEWTVDAAPVGQGTGLPRRSHFLELQSPYVKPYHAAEVVDPLLSVVKPSEWTTVSSDDGLLRKLLGLYFLHEYQWFPSFQKDYFLQDMAAGRSSCCSPLLVNAVLAVATRAYQELSNRYEYWNPRNLGYQFLAEATRLWEIETTSGRVRLTTIQAAVLMDVAHIMNAMDAVGASYLREAVDMAQRVGLFTSVDDSKKGSRKSKAKAFTAWALFNFQSILSYSIFEPPLVQSPPAIPLPDPSIDPGWYGQIWLRYPVDPKLYTTHFPHQFKAQAEVRFIMNDNWLRQFGKGVSSSAPGLHETNEFYSRLRKWYDDLPEPLTPAKITFPSQLMLHIHYHNVIAKLYEPIRAATDQPTLSFRPTDTSLNPVQIRNTSANHFETLLRLYYLRHGFAHADTFLGKPLIQLGFMSLNKIYALTTCTTGPPAPNVNGANLDVIRSTLLLAAKGVHEQGKNIYLAQVILGVLRAKMGPDEKQLVGRVIYDRMDGSGVNSGGVGANDGADGSDKGVTAAGTQLKEVRSRLLPSAVSFSGDPEVHRLGNLVNQQMRLDEGGDDKEADEE